MVDIVIRALTKEEVHDLRMLKAQMDEPTWRALFLRIRKEWQKYRQSVLKCDSVLLSI